MNTELLKKDNIPISLLAMLEGSNMRLPKFPDINNTNVETKFIPGGPSSSFILNNNFEEVNTNIKLLNLEKEVLTKKVDTTNLLLSGLNTLSSVVSSIVSGLTVNATGHPALVDFYSTSTAILSSNYSYDSLYGQATLPYLKSPDSQIVRSSGNGVKSGTTARFKRISNSTVLTGNLINTFTYDNTDDDIYFSLDGRLDTSWATEVLSNEDLLVNVVLTESLGSNAYINALGVIPWPLFSTTLVEVWIRDYSTSSEWLKLSNEGQLNYNSNTTNIEKAGAHRYIFNPALVKEIVVRIRPSYTTKIGLVSLDCWSIEFQSVGQININASVLNIPAIKKVSVFGLPSYYLDNLRTSVVGSQIVIPLSSALSWESPVITSIGISPLTTIEESTGTGFDIDTFSI